MNKKYTLKQLVSQKYITLWDIGGICGVRSKQGVYNILDGINKIYTNELRQLVDRARANGLDISVDDVNTDELYLIQFGK